jgi:BlaI family penicillinase repressor
VPQQIPSLGELEIRVLRLVWQQQPCTERQISDSIQQQRPVGRTTVLKTMQRLEAKGLLVRTAGRSPVRFRAAVDEEHLLPKLIRRFVQQTLGGSPGPLVAYLADSQKLSAKDVEALRRIARKVAGQTDEKSTGVPQ